MGGPGPCHDTVWSIPSLPRGRQSKILDVTLAMKAAVESAKAALASATVLAHPAPDATRSLTTDASNSHVGAVLAGRHWRSLSFFSQKLTPAQQKYSTFHRELTAIFSELRHFQFLLEGRQFRIFTDHKSLVTAFCHGRPSSNDSCHTLLNSRLTFITCQARKTVWPTL
jgi:RNase H-like domain found in reverse transcriptase